MFSRSSSHLPMFLCADSTPPPHPHPRVLPPSQHIVPTSIWHDITAPFHRTTPPPLLSAVHLSIWDSSADHQSRHYIHAVWAGHDSDVTLRAVSNVIASVQTNAIIHISSNVGGGGWPVPATDEIGWRTKSDIYREQEEESRQRRGVDRTINGPYRRMQYGGFWEL